MTSMLRRLGPSIASALATAAIFTTVLWVQQARQAWPFDVPVATVAESPGEPRPPDGAEANARVAIDAVSAASLDIRLETVGRQALNDRIRAVAIVVPDESRIAHVHTRVSGWIERLDVNTTGEMVRAGQPLARVFSQELLASQTEYLSARRHLDASGITSAVVSSGRTRLGVLGMTPADIDAIEQSGEPTRLVIVRSPRDGVIVNRGVTVGTSVDPSTTLLTIADLSRVWVLAEVPEASISAINVGTVASIDFPASGLPPLTARVDFIYPTLTERTRTLRVRLSVSNRGGRLRPGLYGTAAFEIAGSDVMTVPRDAVVDTGLTQHVFVAVGDRFEPRAVTLGTQLADRVEVRAGLAEGERIVAAGVFLLDSESRLRATGGAGTHNHGAPSAGQPAAPPLVDPHEGHAPAAANATAPDPHAGHARPPAKPHAGPHTGQ